MILCYEKQGSQSIQHTLLCATPMGVSPKNEKKERKLRKSIIHPSRFSLEHCITLKQQLEREHD